ncbi:tryptophan-rich sensory protein [Candidatus Peregrinibacteria bacterium]|nr:tryptophan-rich sensory protein [Candidatus Peregrinibacteria bacterium]
MLKPAVQKKIKTIFYSVIVFLIAVTVILTGATFTDLNVYWYVSLNKPFHPPYWIHVVAWMIIFILITISAIIILSEKEKRKSKCPFALPLYLINAFLVPLYSVLFFGFRAANLAFIETIFTLAAILLLIWCNYKISKTAAYLLMPYLLWICYSVFLNAMIIFAN